MKKYFYLLFAFIATITIAACSEDDEPKTSGMSDVIEKEIVGNYGGNLVINVDEVEFPPVPQGISIKKGTGENTISLSIADFSFMGIELGDINLNDCPLTGKDGNYAFTSDEALTLKTDDGFLATVNLKNAQIVKEEISFDLDIDATVGDVNQKVKVSYKGKRGQAVEEDKKSNEAKVLSFKFDENYEEHPMHKVLVDLNAVIDEEAKTITFRVDKDLLAEETYAEALKGLYPTIEVSEGATYSPTEGFDFSNAEAPVKITVAAEDGETVAEYTVNVIGYIVPTVLKNSFEEWVKDKGTSSLQKGEWETPAPKEVWSSANAGVAAMRSQLGGNYSGDWSMLPTEGKTGKGVLLKTLDTRNISSLVPAVTPGFFYTGEFKFNMFQGGTPLKMTHIGIDFKGKPKALKVTYKYTKGSVFVDGSNKEDVKVIEGAEDKGLILAVLFDPSVLVDDKNKSITWLDGYTLKKEENHVMSAWIGGKEGVADTNGEWVTVEIPFEDLQGYDSNKAYKLALACQSSVEGDIAKGAVGSELIIDEIEVIAE